MIQERSSRVSVVIPHLNQPDFLSRCLASLSAMTVQPAEIIVVDNGSGILPHEICDRFSGITLLQEKTPGPGPARNLGVAHATGDIIAFIDADCLADVNWLSVALHAMIDSQKVILGGDVRIARSNPHQLTALEAYESIYAYRMERYIVREGFTGTGNLVVRRWVLDKVGPFGGLSVAEDRDWGQRATGMGYKISYVEGLKVYHPARRHFAELVQKWDRHMSHDFILAQQTPRWRIKWCAKTIAMGISPLLELPRIMVSDRISGMRSRILAFYSLTRIRGYRTKRMIQLLGGLNPNTLTSHWNRPD